LAAKIAELRPGLKKVRFSHDNARPHIAKSTREKLLELGWDILVYPPYFPDLAPSDFQLFLSMNNALQSESFVDDDHLKQWLADFFASKPAQYYNNGIHSLPDMEESG
jgi:histone-lysine N-methyltransferase SETMAR